MQGKREKLWSMGKRKEEKEEEKSLLETKNMSMNGLTILGCKQGSKTYNLYKNHRPSSSSC